MRLRAAFSPLFALLVAASFDFGAAPHAHRDGGQSLRDRSWASVDSTAPCDAAPHWDRAHLERRSSCVACLLSASCAAAIAAGALAGSGDTAPCEPAFAPERSPSPVGVGPRAGRGPPLPVSPA